MAPELPSGLSLSSHLRCSPRARYNHNLVLKVQRAIESEPEADLTSILSKYSTERLKELRGVEDPPPSVPVPRPKPEVIQPPIPEPYGDFKVISPLAPQLQTLMGLNPLDRLEMSLPPVTCFWYLLRNGEVLNQVGETWVIRILPSVVVKFAPSLDLSAHQTLCHIWSHRGEIPMPEPLGAITIGKRNYIFMSYIEGNPLAKLWPNLSHELKHSVQSQLVGMLRHLRSIPLESRYLGSGNPPLCRDERRHVRTSAESISNETEFNAFLTSGERKLNPVLMKIILSTMRTNHKIVMTHSDLRPENIMVQQTTPDTIKITGIVDWELCGAYPEYWEYIKALAGVYWNMSDWYAYLPTEAIGEHNDAWGQECLIDRLVL